MQLFLSVVSVSIGVLEFHLCAPTNIKEMDHALDWSTQYQPFLVAILAMSFGIGTFVDWLISKIKDQTK